MISKSQKRSIGQRVADLKSRRPHRSFQLTRRRDYRRQLELPGYFAFLFEVATLLRRHWRLFGLLVISYVVFGILLGTMTSQDTYNAMSGTVRSVSDGIIGDSGIGAVLQAGAISFTTFISGNKLTDIQKVYMSLVFLFTWLTTVWLLREIVAGREPRLRDGIYNAGAPIIPTILVMLWMLVQLLPIVLLMIIYGGLVNAGLMTNGFGTFSFAMLFVLVISLVLYWLTSTFIATVAVTLPGMYPSVAIRAAGDIVVGRRLRILFRILWMLVSIAIVWLAVMILIVMFDTWLADRIDWVAAVPWVPILATLLSGAMIVYACSYIYLLYRKVVADGSNPA